MPHTSKCSNHVLINELRKSLQHPSHQWRVSIGENESENDRARMSQVSRAVGGKGQEAGQCVWNAVGECGGEGGGNGGEGMVAATYRRR